MTDYYGTDDYTDYLFQSEDSPPLISEMYEDISEEFKIQSLDISYFDEQRVSGIDNCPRLKAVWQTLIKNFNLYYSTREIGGMSEYDFFCMMQSCLNRNADTFERQLKVYDDDIANPILGRTEEVIYDTSDDRNLIAESTLAYGSSIKRTENGSDIIHHIDVPADNPEFDTDRSRDKTDYGHITEDTNSGQDTNTGTNNETRKMTGTVTTKLSDIGVRPNYESLNGFLDNNRTFIQEFINKFDECFAPRYRRVLF